MPLSITAPWYEWLFLLDRVTTLEEGEAQSRAMLDELLASNAAPRPSRAHAKTVATLNRAWDGAVHQGPAAMAAFLRAARRGITGPTWALHHLRTGEAVIPADELPAVV